MTTDRTARTGLLLGIGAYVSWGILPLYLKLLKGVPALQVLAHRILWSLLLLAVVVLIARRGPAFERRRGGGPCCCCARVPR